MTTQSRLASALDRVASLTSTKRIREKDQARGERNGSAWARDEGLEARVDELEDQVALLTKKITA